VYARVPVGFRLGQAPFFSGMIKESSMAANEQHSPQPAATVEQMHEAFDAARHQAIRAALALIYSACGRKLDIFGTKRKEITLADDFIVTGKMLILFVRGKGARFSQPYTVPTTMPAAWRVTTRDYLESKQPEDWLFPGGDKAWGSRLRTALRVPSLGATVTVRAIRRGALQAMAHAGVDAATLMLFSGHKRVETLMRYLNWGAEAEALTAGGQRAALHLDRQV
jgi:integrase